MSEIEPRIQAVLDALRFPDRVYKRETIDEAIALERRLPLSLLRSLKMSRPGR